MSGNIFVIGKEQFHEVSEGGYFTLYVNENINLDNIKWVDYKLVLDKVFENCSMDNVGICTFDYYFLDGSRLLSIDKMEILLQQYDAILPIDRKKRNISFLTNKSIFVSYYNWVNEDVTHTKYFDEWIIDCGVTIGHIAARKIDTNRMQMTYDSISQLTENLVKAYLKYGYEPLEAINKKVAASSRVPIWVCWWQGEESMPLIVKKCLQSMRKAFAGRNAEIYVITLKNYREYVVFSDVIQQRFEEGAIPYTHMSDVLRAQLLCRYGGIWLDATCFVFDNKFIDLLLEYPFYTRKVGGRPNELDIVSGRWSTYFIKGPANYKLFRFWVDSFELYWQKYDELINYFIFDYITAIAYNKFGDIRAIFDAVPINNSASEVLVKWCNDAYDKNKLELLLSNSWLFKMTYKEAFNNKTIDDEDTFFKVIFDCN